MDQYLWGEIYNSIAVRMKLCLKKNKIIIIKWIIDALLFNWIWRWIPEKHFVVLLQHLFLLYEQTFVFFLLVSFQPCHFDFTVFCPNITEAIASCNAGEMIEPVAFGWWHLTSNSTQKDWTTIAVVFSLLTTKHMDFSWLFIFQSVL